MAFRLKSFCDSGTGLVICRRHYNALKGIRLAQNDVIIKATKADVLPLWLHNPVELLVELLITKECTRMPPYCPVCHNSGGRSSIDDLIALKNCSMTSLPC